MIILLSVVQARKSSDFKKAKDCIHFLHHEQLDCDHSGLDYVIENHDITLRIPEGAVAEGEMVHFEVGVAMHGPFCRPENTQPISPILWLCHLEDEVKLNKSLELILPHCYAGSVMPPDQLTFAIADHTSLKDIAIDRDGQPYYLLKLWKVGTNLYMDKMYGAIRTDLCSHIFCIVKQTRCRHWCQDIGFSLARVDLQPSQTVHEFHFYGLFNLATNRIVSKDHDIQNYHTVQLLFYRHLMQSFKKMVRKYPPLLHSSLKM